jgi:short-subunit dehydrogenase
MTNRSVDSVGAEPCERPYALITGASSGIGREFAHLFAKDGWNLVLTARDEARLGAVKVEAEERHGVRAIVLARDLADPSVPAGIFTALDREGVIVSALVNDAGFNVHGLFEVTDLERELEMIQVHVTALTHLTKLFLRQRPERTPAMILNVSSIAAFVPGPNVSVHFATRAYVLSFSEALARELSGTGVSVTCLCPGPTRSEFFARAGMENVRLATGWPLRLMDARAVAEVGYAAMKRGKVVTIPGFQNKVIALFARHVPRALATGVTGWFMTRT